MKRIFSFLLFLSLLLLNAKAEDNSIYRIVPGKDYYIWNIFYDRPLTLASAQTGPVLSVYDETKDDNYVFTAVEAPTEGYVLLKHKASGKFICASTSNTYSTVAQSSASTGDSYQWRIKPGKNGYLVNKRSTNKSLGVDENENKDEIGVWYDKDQGLQRTRFEIFEACGKNMAESRKMWAKRELTNVCDYVRSEIACYLNTGSDNTRYSLVAVKKFAKTLEQVDGWMANADAYSTEQFMNKAELMRDSLCTYFSGSESSVLLTKNDMQSFGNSFSLGVTELQMSDRYPDDYVTFVLRNKIGLGAIFHVTSSGNYTFTQEGAKTCIYRNGELVEKIESYYVPAVSTQVDEPEWTMIRKSRIANALPEILSENKAITSGGGISVDKNGNNTRTVVSLTNTQLELNDPIDFHIISEIDPLGSSTINLNNEKAWLIFDNVRPSEVISTYLKQIKIKGVSAANNTNCRVVIYLNGALVMPYTKNDIVFEGYDGEQYTKEKIGFRVGTNNDLGEDANRIRSFRLKRGYMATLASGKDGSGYSRVYVADHKDIEVPVLPNALYGRISSITIKKWQYVSKKGWCSTNDNNAIASQTSKVRATWYYTWSADRSSTYDTEYIPIRQHKWWPSITQIASHEDATACLSLNEPEHSEQHKDCDCGGAINEWTSCTLTPDFQKTGMRIGSPSPTDAGWLTNYINHCNDMAYRCDFVAIHAYWGDNEAANADAWYNKLKAIYDATKRPIWITEWAFGASWTKEGWPSGWNDKLEHNRAKVKAILEKLEAAPFVERYAYYQWDTQFRNLVDWSDGHITPAGKVYRDLKSDFAYNASVQFTPVWWAPSLKNPSMKVEVNDADMTLAVTVTNENTDCTDILAIQKFNNSTKSWENYYVEEDRSKFDDKTINYTFPLADFDMENDQLRVYVKRTLGDEAMSAGNSTGYIQNPNIFASNKTTIDGWKCQKSAQNGFTKDTGDTYFEVWSEKAVGQQFDYYQELTDLPSGVYELSADVFNSSNKEDGAVVNGAVVLYAQADSVQYLANVTKDSELADADRLHISNIIVRNGKMRLGIKNVGVMTARWAGADNFKLIRIEDIDDNWELEYYQNRIMQDENSRNLFFKTKDENTADASAYVVNPSCQRTDNYAWTVTNAETASNESSDGQSNNAYWNKWQGSAYISTLTQDIAFLPEGRYSANALLRGSSDAKEISLTASVIDSNGNEKSEKAILKGTGNTTIDASSYKNGWQKVETAYVTVRPGDILRLKMNAEFSKSGWWSADDFGLTWQYVEPIATHIDDIENEDSQKTVKSRKIFDLNGRALTTRNASKLKKGIYIIDNKKVVK